MIVKVLDRFRDGLEKILITTNVLSRGIDIEQVTIVVNFDLPVDVNGAADCKSVNSSLTFSMTQINIITR